MTALPGVAIGVRTADCVPVLLYDPVERVVTAVHSGWKGTVLHIVRKATSVMTTQFGCKAENMRAAIGPSIGPDSFQVGEEVVEQFRESGFPMSEIWTYRGGGNGKPMSGGHHIDLWAANCWLLEQAGLPSGHIQVCGIDTYANASFFSARREGVHCGRIINSLCLMKSD